MNVVKFEKMWSFVDTIYNNKHAQLWWSTNILRLCVAQQLKAKQFFGQ